MLGQCAKCKIKEKRPEKVNCAQRPTQKGRAPERRGPRKIRGTQNVPWHNTPLALYGRFLYIESCVQHTRKPTRSHAHTRATRVSPATTAASTRRARGRRVGGDPPRRKGLCLYPPRSPPRPPTHTSPPRPPPPRTQLCSAIKERRTERRHSACRSQPPRSRRGSCPPVSRRRPSRR
jgi:hypothetical protein